MTTRQNVWMVAAITTGLVSTAQGATIFVDIANCPGPGDGSVGDPYCSIQTAIDNAVDTDEIVVAEGTYVELIDFSGKAITVRSSDPNDAGVVLNTIIDGAGAGAVVTCQSGEAAATILSGFTITGGGLSAFGGGMYNLNSSPTVTNCSFSVNDAVGAGMGNDNSSPTVTNCTFIGNTSSQNGGGMYNFGNSNPTVTDCTFIGNTADASGGGMFNLNGNPTLNNCTFIANTCSHSGGGIYNSNFSSPTVTNCTFSENTANDNGGGMNNTGVSSPSVTNCTFSGNTANDNGGGMNNAGGSPTLTNCTFSGNSAAIGGGLSNSSGDPTMTNTGFCGNTPDQINGTFTDAGGSSLLYCPPPMPLPDTCPADIVNNGDVGINDFLDLLAAWGPCK